MVKSGRAPILRGGLQLGLGCRCAGRCGSACRPPRRDSSGSAAQRLLGAAEMVDELAKGDGADVVAADQAQARQALCRVERRLRKGCRRQPRAQCH